MRTYPRNSPQAAARIVALALTSDGHVCSSEERVLQKLNIAGELGLVPAQFEQIVQTLCEDLSVAHPSYAPQVGRLDPAMTTFASSNALADAMRRAEAAHGEHEKRIGHRDADWADWYAIYIAAEQSGKELPT